MGENRYQILKLIWEKYCVGEKPKLFDLRKQVTWEGRKINFRLKKNTAKEGLSEEVTF